MPKPESHEFELDMTISPKLVLAGLITLWVVVFLVADGLSDTEVRARVVELLALWFLVCIVMVLLPELTGEAIVRWLAVLGPTLLLLVGCLRLDIPELPTLFVIPVALAFAVIGARAGLSATFAASLIAVILPSSSATEGGRAIALVAIWSVSAILVAVQYPVWQAARQSSADYYQARAWLEEARDRREELERALDDLAHANRQLALTNERLAVLRAVAQDAQKTKAAFLSKVSHEFRTPLNMIIGLADLLVETPEFYGEALPSQLAEHLEIVARNSKHLSRMVDDVLDLSQIDAGRMVLHREMIDLRKVIEGALELIRPLAEKKHIVLRVSGPDQLPDVYCDRVRITQVMVNLLSNAARFTERGEIHTRLVNENGHVVVSVTDTGPGVPEEFVERIFEPFCQATPSVWQDKGGSGLGLSVSKQFVRLHGGRMWLESELGVGSTFYFTLPLSGQSAPVVGPQRWISSEWEWLRRERRQHQQVLDSAQRVIICDETDELYRSFARYSEGVEYVHTRDIGQTVREWHICPAQAVVVNAPLPHDLCQMVDQARREMSTAPIIGCCVPSRLEPALAAGATNYLIKPITRADIAELLENQAKFPKRVLVVDDDRDALLVLTALLHSVAPDLEVETATTGAQALDVLRRLRPDLTLLDILMPDMNGWQVLHAKHREEQIAELPVVLVSAQDPREKPMLSQIVVAAMGEGLSINKIMLCAQQLSTLLVQAG
jgi:signal transduction histidine kinase/CheY-like chemotaxis protein